MSAALEMPAPWRAWPVPRRQRCATAAELNGLNARLDAVYRALVPDLADHMPAAQRRRLRRTLLRSSYDLRQVRRYAADHVLGLRVTLEAAAFDPDARRLLGPEVLLILERLHVDPLGLRDDWPTDEALAPLLAMADANARPYAA